MSNRPDDLLRRRALLVSRSAQQRADIVANSQAISQDLRPPLQVVEHGVRIVKNLRHHPGWIAGILIGVVLIKPRRILGVIEAAQAGSRTFGVVESIFNRLRR